MKKIIKVHHPKVKEKLVKEALEIFFDVRKVPGLKKKPSTSELVDWLKLLMADDLPDEILKNRDPSKAIPPLYGAWFHKHKIPFYLSLEEDHLGIQYRPYQFHQLTRQLFLQPQKLPIIFLFCM